MIVYGVLLSLAAGLAITLGAFLASIEFCKRSWVEQELKHGIIAFGGGALISAIAFVLIPDGVKHQSAISVLMTFLCGGLVFMGLDMALARSKARLSQFIAMMLDFVPEAIVLGAVVTGNLPQACFIAAVIAAQNLPEGYAAFLELKEDGKSSRSLLLKFLIVGLSGPLYIFLGAYVFADHRELLAPLMTFCAGGILYLVFEDIAPKVKLESDWLPPLGAVLGFMVGLAGYLYT